MSQEKLAALIGRAAVDSDFLELIKTNPQSIVDANLDLSDDEKDAILNLDATELDSLHAATAATALRAIVNKKDG